MYSDEVQDYKIDKIEKIKENIIPDKQIKVEYKESSIDKNYLLNIVEEVLSENIPHSKTVRIMEDLKKKLI